MTLRMAPEWVSQADERILEYFDEQNVATAEMMAKDERVSLNRNYITQRLSLLYGGGLLEKTGRGTYRITEAGVEFLQGELDLRDEPKPD